MQEQIEVRQESMVLLQEGRGAAKVPWLCSRGEKPLPRSVVVLQEGGGVVEVPW